MLPLARRGALGSEVHGFVEFVPSLGGATPAPTEAPKPTSIHHVTIERPETLVEFVGALQVRQKLRLKRIAASRLHIGSEQPKSAVSKITIKSRLSNIHELESE